MPKTIAQVLDGFVERDRVGGASVLLLRDGREIYYYETGLADRAENRPWTRDTLCHMFSTSKPVVGVGAMMLVEQGKLALDAPVSRYIPAFARTPVAVETEKGVELVPAAREITLHDLFTMTSGIPYPGDTATPVARAVTEAFEAIHRRMHADAAAGQPWGTLQYVEEIAACPTLFQPGSHWKYGLSCDVLGGVIEAVTGMTLGQYLKKAIFDPLGMKDTFFLAPPEKQARVAQIYTDGADGGLIPWQEQTTGFVMIDNPRFESGGAGLISTADDYGRFAAMLLGKGTLDGVTLLAPETLAIMTRPQLTPAQWPDYHGFNTGDEYGYSYGYMMRTMTDPAASGYPGEGVGAFGWNGKAGTSLRIDPAHRLAVVFLTQRVPPDHRDYLPALCEAIYASLGTLSEREDAPTV